MAYKRPLYNSNNSTPAGEDNLLSYYQSSIPNQYTPTAHTRKHSTTSTSSDSDYSCDSDPNHPASTTRRSATPSKGGADRRRVAVVQMDSASQGYRSSSETASTTGSIRSRRGHKSNLAGLALVAPPDAALRTYTQLTPPSTAPITGDQFEAHQDKGLHRSTSLSSKVSSRVQPSHSSIPNLFSESGMTNNRTNGQHPDTRQRTTTTRSTSPDDAWAQTLLSPSTIDMFSPIITPEIGEGKEIHVPVAAPVVVNLDEMQHRKVQSLASWKPQSFASASVHSSPRAYAALPTSAYLHYEPGVHATAGPLPPPPGASFPANPPPRPPRLNSPALPRTRGDLDAVKQALQLPPSVSAALASRSPNIPTIKSVLRVDEQQESVTENQSSRSQSISIHRREGATLSSSPDPSSLESCPSVIRQPSSVSTSSNADGKPLPSDDQCDPPVVTVVEDISRSDSQQSDKVDVPKFDQWLKDNPQLAQPSDNSKRAMSPDGSPPERSMSPLSADHTGEAPSLPPKTFRNSLSNNLKRFSTLPRTPSLSSGRRSSGSTHYSRTPSPTPRPTSLPSFTKVVSSNPAALYCHEVHSQSTTLQRCAIYANKINELYVHDCGLTGWVVETKSRGQHNQTQGQKRPSSSQAFIQQPRQTSRSSMTSEVTFPIRPDASVATDLSQGAYTDLTPPGLPPALPYPSLAMNPPRSSQPSRSNSTITATPPQSLRSLAPSPSTKSAGFFASLGRKASLSSRKERFPPGLPSAGLTSPLTGRLMPKSSKLTMSTATSISRSINIPAPGAVPGGPRAPSRRPQRSQTFTSVESTTYSSELDHDGALGRRPSLFNLGMDNVIDIQPDPVFWQQVDQLAALVPHADRDVLAGYLRRSGQDMLAIGQYLDDERMGTLRQP